MGKIKLTNVLYTTIFIFFVSMIAIFISIKYYDNQIADAIDSQVKENLERNCTYTNTSMNLSVEHIVADLRYISSYLTTPDNVPSTEKLKELLANYSGNHSLENTHFIQSTSLVALSNDENLRAGEKELLKNFQNGESVSFIQDGRGINVYIAVPLYQGKNIIGLLYTYYSVDYFTKNIVNQSSINGIKSFIVCQDMTLLTQISDYHNLKDVLKNYTLPANISIASIEQDFIENKSNTMAVLLKDQKYYIQYSPCGINNWFLLNICKEEDAASQISILSSSTRSLYSHILLIVAILLFLVLVVQCFINLRNSKNYQRLLLEKACYETAFELNNGVLWEYDIKNDTLTKSDPDQGFMTPLAITEHFTDYVNESDIIYPDDIENFNNFFLLIRDGCKSCTAEVRAKDITGNYKWFEITATSITDSNNQPMLAIGQTISIDAEKNTLEQIKAARETDPLTKLYNRKTAEARISSLISQENESKIHALLLLDIDHFKEVNNSFGYVFGDALLVDLASRLSKYYKSEKNVLCRVGGDSFLIYLTDIPSASYAMEKGHELISILHETFKKQDKSRHVSGSVGLSLYPVDGSNVSTLLSRAYSAMMYSKKHGTNGVYLYNSAFMNHLVYDEYFDDVHAKNSYQLMDQTIIDSSLITNAVEILFDARDIESSINMILSIIGSYYDLYCIAIIEKSEEDYSGSFTYTWRSDAASDLDFTYELSPSCIGRLDQYNNEYNNTFYCSNPKEFKKNNPALADILMSYSISGFLECGINNNGQSLGYIVFTYKDKERTWNDADIDSISLITKILGGYLFNLRAQAKAYKLQRTDPLTNANNLTAFSDDAMRLIYANPSTNYVLFYSDINKFKLINDTYGYSEGDRLLVEFANALNSIMDQDECFGRVNADKFIGLFNYNNPKHFLGKIRVLHDIMNQIPRTENDMYRVSIIIGLCPVNDNRNLSVVIDRANIARKSITNRHKSRYAFFSESMKSDLVKQREIEDLMEISLHNDDFLVYLQPKVYLKDKQICGAEALVRWQHPTKGLIAPNEFITIFEENQFIIKLDYYVFEQTCKHIRRMLDARQKVYPISVNMSRLHLNNNDVLTKLMEIVDKYKVPTHYLEIELTESALQENSGYMFSILFQLHKMGFIISMDDFGSGLSSLNLLRTLPFDELKLDKDFFQQGTSTERERIVITNIVRMAQDLNMTIVSEGVETEEQAEFLSSINCDIAQGYLFARPMPMEEYESIYYPNV